MKKNQPENPRGNPVERVRLGHRSRPRRTIFCALFFCFVVVVFFFGGGGGSSSAVAIAPGPERNRRFLNPFLNPPFETHLKKKPSKAATERIGNEKETAKRKNKRKRQTTAVRNMVPFPKSVKDIFKKKEREREREREKKQKTNKKLPVGCLQFPPTAFRFYFNFFSTTVFCSVRFAGIVDERRCERLF